MSFANHYGQAEAWRDTVAGHRASIKRGPPSVECVSVGGDYELVAQLVAVSAPMSGQGNELVQVDACLAGAAQDHDHALAAIDRMLATATFQSRGGPDTPRQPMAGTPDPMAGLAVPSKGCASIEAMLEERRIPTRTAEWRTIHDRIQIAMELTSRLNVLPFSDVDSRNALLNQLLGKPLPDKAIIHPPFYSTYGLGIELGERTSVGQACSFLDLGGITIGDRTMISPKVTLITEGHPIEPAERYSFITVAPIVIEEHVWIGAAATVLPGVRIGHDSVVGAGAVVAKDVPPLTVVTGAGYVHRRHVEPAPSSAV